MSKPKAWMAWSSGKDSAWALHQVRQEKSLEITGLITTLSDAFNRVSMHGVRLEVLQAQAAELELPLHLVRIPNPCPNDLYEAAMQKLLEQGRAEGVSHIIFGDIFLQDIRAYREKQLQPAGLTAHFPLWGGNSAQLAREMIQGGLRAVLVCLDSSQVPENLSGHLFTEDLINSLPKGVDACGERGEFHTLVFGGPMFKHPLLIKPGEIHWQDHFLFKDFLLVNQ